MVELHPQPLQLPGDTAEQPAPAAFDVAKLDFRQIVLRQQTAPQPWQWTPSVEAIAAMEKLLDQLRQLRSPESGWDPTLPQTTETLAPYLSEEASDLLDAIEADLDAGTVPTPAFLLQTHQVCRLDALIPKLLWAIAQSQPLAMQLLEGAIAQVRQAGGTMIGAGILRLVVVLELETASQKGCWDVVMAHPPTDFLPADAIVEVQPMTVEAVPCEAIDLLQQIEQLAQQSLPELNDWFHGQTVELLLPNQGWQASRLTLKLGLAFVPQRSPLNATVNSQHLLPSSPTPHLHFTDAAWVAQFHRMTCHSRLCKALPGMAAVRTIAQANSPLSTEEAIAHLTQAALDWLKDNTRTNFLEATERSLDPMAAQLSWQIAQVAYPVMQLLGGVAGQKLQADLSWKTGILRLRPLLSLQTPETDWLLDLAHQQFLTAAPPLLEPTLVVQSEALPWCQQPTLLKDLTCQLQSLLETHHPELLLLQQGTEVDLLWEGVEAMPGALQLKLAFEFL